MTGRRDRTERNNQFPPNQYFGNGSWGTSQGVDDVASGVCGGSIREPDGQGDVSAWSIDQSSDPFSRIAQSQSTADTLEGMDIGAESYRPPVGGQDPSYGINVAFNHYRHADLPQAEQDLKGFSWSETGIGQNAYPAPQAANTGQQTHGEPFYDHGPVPQFVDHSISDQAEFEDLLDGMDNEPEAISDPVDLNNLNVNLRRDEPWFCQPNIIPPEFQAHAANQCIGSEETSDTNRLTFENVNTDSSYVMVNGLITSMSSTGPSNMRLVGESWLTERPYDTHPGQPVQQEQDFGTYGPLPGHRPLSLVQHYLDSGISPGDVTEPDRLVAPPVQRDISSTVSFTTEASSLGADAPDVLHCPETGCESVFTRSYRKGNLRRHKKLYHGQHGRYECESGCDISFKRNDARVRHYRKCHPERASPYVARGPWKRSGGGGQDDDLRNISSWTG
ncbi:hypothetical protein BDW02DRAFT_119615 [Decorospora gaudefroyi]|uniref:C2H2-type domain-containing protein n=1 Tax=Decorospora gaudefroyi TaxID=184978 RepID=A0A6A5KNS4_9PLEO|nr:hypothetical protein BDW02DRAFT_119615 [Decorospora gaudefroyi]